MNRKFTTLGKGTQNEYFLIYNQLISLISGCDFFVQNDPVTNLGSVKYPWIIEAKLNFSSNPNASIVIQTEAIVINGTAEFTKLAISDITDKFIISYNFKLPQGIDE